MASDAASRGGFTVAGVFYTWPESFRLGDPVLVREVTGMDWPEFVDKLDQGDTGDPSVIAGMIAVGIWQANPRWARDKARRVVEQLDLADLDIQSPEEEADVGPPEVSPPSDVSPDPSSLELDAVSDGATPVSSGVSG